MATPVLMNRYLKSHILKELKDKLILIGGPRQVGKTTLAISFLKPPTIENPAYLNWDYVTDRASLVKGLLPQPHKILVLDEIHKYARWRNLLKGFFDKLHLHTSFIVTGSARLDHYRKGGDSLFGRHRFFRLHPFSLNEMTKNPGRSDLEHLLKFGGFPEPLFKGDSRSLRLWQLERLEKVVKEDVRDLENVREISLLELLVEALPERVGSPLSVKSLKEDLQVAHDTVERWLKILENLYVCYRIPPFGAPKIRAVKKEQKLYMWDHAQVPEEGGFRFENLVANQLLKYCHFIQDTEGHRMELRYLRDVDGREVDFVVIKDKNPAFAVECKSGEKRLSPAISYFIERTAVPMFYQVHLGTADFAMAKTKPVRIMPFTTFCKELSMP